MANQEQHLHMREIQMPEYPRKKPEGVAIHEIAIKIIRLSIKLHM